MNTLVLVAIGVAVLVLLIVLEGKRQERNLGEKASGSPNALGNALLEVQGMLEPDRKVEVMHEALQNEDRVEGEHEQLAGDQDPSRDRSG